LLVCRIICEKVNGQPPMGYLATHSWSKGKLGCVNPHHLRWKTPKGNYEDQMTRGTAAKGERNGRAVLTKEKVEEIRALRGKGLTQREVGYKFGVSDVTIYNIWSGKTWKK
jgi:DNA-binding XRE family transcriptional regulator